MSCVILRTGSLLQRVWTPLGADGQILPEVRSKASTEEQIGGPICLSKLLLLYLFDCSGALIQLKDFDVVETA